MVKFSFFDLFGNHTRKYIESWYSNIVAHFQSSKKGIENKKYKKKSLFKKPHLSISKLNTGNDKCNQSQKSFLLTNSLTYTPETS